MILGYNKYQLQWIIFKTQKSVPATAGHCTKMDQDDLEDELIWKTVVAHFDMVSEKISYREAYLVVD